ncbi:MAG: (2Fe-2S)-binding protein [Armatimonadota bacterium]|jgi:aerobic-type carbon monoxide dehydrogenase small subunit (CoxS/CutS family)
MDELTLRVNGVEHEVTVDGSRSLLSVLRTELGMTGTKYGCGAGECGACTVMMDDQAVRSCVLPVSAAQGRSITTIEGLGAGKLHPVQEAFLEVQAFQCGYCTPGQVMNAAALLRRSPSPSESDIRTAMSGNLCRCATYQRIIRAVQLAAQKMSGVR